MWSLFHEIGSAGFVIKKVWIGIVLFSCVAGKGYAQEISSAAQEAKQQDTETQPLDQEPNDGEWPAPTAVKDNEEIRSRGGQTFSDDVFENARYHMGFSLSAYQAYSNDISSTSTQRQSSGISSFIPRIFFNAGRKKSSFHLDLGSGYRMYSKEHELNSWDYYGGSQYSYQFSKRSSFQIADQFTSSFNDSWSFISLSSPLHYDMSSSNEVMFNRQRINRNSLFAQLDFSVGRKVRLGAFGTYQLYRYPQKTLSNSDSLEAGGSFALQLTKWLSINNSFSSYLNVFGGNSPEAKIYHLQIGGLDFRLTKYWRIFAGGGFDFSDSQGQRQKHENINSGFSYTAPDTSINITYQRQFTAAIGISKLLTSDIYAATFGHRLFRRTNITLQSYYYKSDEQNTNGSLKTFSAGGGVEYALLRNLVATANAYYQNQQTLNFSVDGLHLNRFTAYIGIQYLWPSMKNSKGMQRTIP